jgi:hypothetical protein
LGEYPATTLAHARELALTTQAAAVNGGDVDVALARPKAIVKAKAAEELAEHGEQLGRVMEAYLAHYARQWSESNLRLVRKRLEKDIIPKYGKTPIKDIEAADLLMHLQKIHDRAPETSHRIYSILAQLWRFARFNKHTDRSPLDTFKVGEIGKVPEGHLDAIVEPGEFGVLLGAIYRHPSIVTRPASLRPLLPAILRTALRDVGRVRPRWAHMDDPGVPHEGQDPRPHHPAFPAGPGDPGRAAGIRRDGFRRLPLSRIRQKAPHLERNALDGAEAPMRETHPARLPGHVPDSGR